MDTKFDVLSYLEELKRLYVSEDKRMDIVMEIVTETLKCKTITRCGKCSLCQKDITIAKSISEGLVFEEEIVNICDLLNGYVDKDDGCTFGIPKEESK